MTRAQLGVAVGFVVGPLLVNGGDGMQDLLIAEAAFATIGAVLVVLLFANEPPVPPSYAAISAAASGAASKSSKSCVAALGRARRQAPRARRLPGLRPTCSRVCVCPCPALTRRRWRAQLVALASNRAFVFLLLAYGANVGMYVTARPH